MAREELVTVNALARRWKVTPQRIDQMIRDGLPVADRSRPRRVSLSAAEAFRAGYTGADGRGGPRLRAGRPGNKTRNTPDMVSPPGLVPAAQPPAPSPAAAEPVEGSLAWQRREIERLKREELEERRAIKRGELVAAAAVRGAFTVHGERIRRRLERHAPTVTSKVLAALKLPPSLRPVVEGVVQADVREILAELGQLPPLQPLQPPAERKP